MVKRTDNITEENSKEKYTKEGYILPNHYFLGQYQMIDIIQDQLSDKAFVGFAKFLTLKYLLRVEEASDESKLRNYKKASYYLNELINRRAKTSEKTNENRIKPMYYKKHQLELVEVIEDQFDDEELTGAYIGVIMKYLLRAEQKHGLEDYEKAAWFLNRLIIYFDNKVNTKK